MVFKAYLLKKIKDEMEFLISYYSKKETKKAA